MVRVAYEISKEEYDKAKAEGADSLICDSIKMGYGVYGAEVTEANGHFYLVYERGESCD